MNAGVTLHVEILYGTNDHHIAEACFKGLARALRAAVAIDPRAKRRGAFDQGDAERVISRSPDERSAIGCDGKAPDFADASSGLQESSQTGA